MKARRHDRSSIRRHRRDHGRRGAPPVLTRAQAETRAAELAKDTQFLNRMYSGDKAAHAEFKRVQEGLKLVDLNVVGGDAAEQVAVNIAERQAEEREREVNAILKVYDFDPATAQQLRERKPVSPAEHADVQKAFDRMRNNDDFMRKVRSGQEPEKSKYGAAMLYLKTLPVARPE